MSKVDLTDQDVLLRLSLLCKKIVLILLKYQRGEPLAKNEKKVLLRGKDLILDKILKATKSCAGYEKINDGIISCLQEGMILYGYALTSLKSRVLWKQLCFFRFADFDGSIDFRIPNFFIALLASLSDIVGGKIIDKDVNLLVKFFREFEKQIRPRRASA